MEWTSIGDVDFVAWDWSEVVTRVSTEDSCVSVVCWDVGADVGEVGDAEIAVENTDIS